MEITCEQCGTSFTPSRSDAKFCSVKCRVNYGRSSPAVTDSVTASPDDHGIRNNGSAKRNSRKPLTSTVTDKVPEITAFDPAQPPVSMEDGSKLPPALHKHDFYPHSHTLLTEGPFKGKRKKCSGRFWCKSCQEWMDGKVCHSDMG